MSNFKVLSYGVAIGKNIAPRVMARLAIGAGLSATLLLSGCATQNIQAYQNSAPTLDMHEFFSGQIDGWGMFQGRNGEVKKRFYVDIDATHEGDNVIVLDEKFAWADGSKSQRIWRLTKQADVAGKAQQAMSLARQQGKWLAIPCIGVTC